MRILFVDDSSDDRELTIMGLRNIVKNLEISEAESAVDAFKKLEKHDYDCILSDYQMPEMDGLEFLQLLRKNENDTPFIFLTGQGNEDVAANALSEGADAYFTKQIDLAYYHRIANTMQNLVEAYRNRLAREKTAESLLSSEEKYRLLFEKQNDPVFLVNIEGNCFVDVNDAAVKLYGYSKAEFMALNPKAISAEPEKTLLTIETLKNEGEAEIKLRRHKKKDGSIILVEISAGTFVWNESKVICSIVRDITKTQKSFVAQAESEKKYRLLYETAPDAIFTVQVDDENNNLRIVDCNSAAIEMFGYESREAIIGLPQTMLFPSHQPNGYSSEEKIAMVVQKALKGDSQYLEWRHKKPDGSEFDSEVMLNSIELDGFRFLQVMVRDVTEKRKIEHDFKLAQFTVEHNGDAAFWISEDGSFSYVNEAACRSLGYSREELLKLGLFDIDPDFTEEMQITAWKELKAIKTLLIESRHRRKDGSIFPVDITANFIQFNGEEHNCAFARDNSNRKRAEEELKKSNIRLSETNKELEAFSYSVSHDLKAPLRSLMGFSQLLLDSYQDKLDEDSVRFLGNIRSSAQEMTDLIANLLKLSRVTQHELLIRTIDFSSITSQIAQNLFKSDPERRITFDVQDGIVAKADEGLLRILLENLINNAWKFTAREKNAIIAISMEQIDGKDTFIVKDNGVGFNPKQSSQLFIPFQRLHSDKQFEGSGIGLATAKRIVRKHGGAIWATAEEGAGATIYFTLN